MRRPAAASVARVATRPRTKRELEEEVERLRIQLAETEQMVHAMANDEVDALVVVTRARGSEEVLTLDHAHVPYQHMVEAVRDGVLTVADDGTILHTNRRFGDLVGKQHAMGTSILDLVDRPERLRTVLQNVSGQPVRFEAALRRADGTRMAAEITASLLPLQGVRRVGLIVVDTGSHAADQPRVPAPPPSRGRLEVPDLESALARVPVGILLVGADTENVVYANHRAEEILGRALVGLERPMAHLGLTCWRPDGSIIEADQLPAMRVLRGTSAVEGEELIVERGDGSVIHTRTSAAPLHGVDGKLVSVIITVEDMTAEVLSRADFEANERFRELFIAVLGHDLRDPLAAIMGGAQLMMRRGGLTPDQTRVLERITHSATRMARLTSEVMDFTRSRLGGGLVLNRNEVLFHDIVRAVIADLQASHPSCEIRLMTDGPGDGAWDGDRLSQVVWNLIGNALVHGGQQPVDVRVVGNEQSLRFEVHNGGAPIAPELLPIIFDPFRRAGDVGRSHGLGLGLYIAQQIVHAHGGTLTVESTAERGTTFTMVLARTH